MEFVNEVLRLDGELAVYTASLLTPGSGADRAVQTIIEELDDLIEPTRPPRWLLLPDDVLVHLAEPMFTALGADADDYVDERDDEFVYVDAAGDVFLRDGDDEYEVARPDIREVEAFFGARHTALVDFVWFGPPPPLVVFVIVLEDAVDAYLGELPAYAGG